MQKRLIVIGPDDLIDIINRSTLSMYEIWYSGKERKARWEERYGCKWAGMNLENTGSTDTKLLVASKSPIARRSIISLAKKKCIKITGVIDRDAIIFESSSISQSTIIYPYAVISSFSKIGENTIISYGSLVGHGVNVEKYAFVSPHVKLLGDSSVGQDSFIGTVTVVLPGVKIGKRAWIGPNLVIGSHITDNTKVIMAGGRLRYLDNRNSD